MQLITIDFETYWAKDLSLRSKELNMSEYVLDDRFSIHMMGIKIDDRPVKVVPGDRVLEELNKINWSESALLCQNTAFDGFILSQHFNVVPAFYYDTLSMGRGAFSVSYPLDLDSLAKYCGFVGKPKKESLLKTKGVRTLPPDLWGEVAAYCADDVNETWNVFNALVKGYPPDELELIDLTIRMFCEPVLQVDLNRVQAALEVELGKKVAALFKANASAEELLSDKKFAELLKSRGVVPPTKTSLTTGKTAYAFAKTDPWMMASRDLPGEVGALVQARLAIKSTIGETRAERLLNVGDRPLPVMLNYCGAHTGRWSAGNKMNLQNLPRGGELRKSILAPKGWVIVVCDSAQIEARVLAWIARHTVLLDLFRAGSDVYKWMAANVYNKAIADITKDERFIGKVCTLGLGYGMGASKLRETLAKGALGAPPLRVSTTQANDWVDAYRYTNSPIVEFWEDANDVLQRMAAGTEMPFGPMEIMENALLLPNGLALHYPELGIREVKGRRGYHYLSRKVWCPIYGGLLTENIVQALARCIVAEQMLRISRFYRVVTMTHDEVVCIAPAAGAERCLDLMISEMKTPPKWAPDLPLGAEGGYDVMYSK